MSRTPRSSCAAATPSRRRRATADQVPSRCNCPSSTKARRSGGSSSPPERRASRSPPPTSGCSRTWPAGPGLPPSPFVSPRTSNGPGNTSWSPARRSVVDCAGICTMGSVPPWPGSACRSRRCAISFAMTRTRRRRCSPSSRPRRRPPSPASARSPTTSDPPPSTSWGWSVPCGKKGPDSPPTAVGCGSRSPPSTTCLPLPAAVEVAAYRIALEAMTNAARHAGATSCVVCVAANDGLDVDVRDDGSGVPPDFRLGVGVSSMRERVSELGGTFTIEGQRCGRNTSPRPPSVGRDMTDPIRVVIADDHPVFRDGLARHPRLSPGSGGRRRGGDRRGGRRTQPPPTNPRSS